MFHLPKALESRPKETQGLANYQLVLGCNRILGLLSFA